MNASELQRLLPECLRGNQDAWGAVYSAYRPLVLAWLVAWGADQEAAEECTQETFVAVYRGLGRLRDCCAFPAWVRRLAKRHWQRHRAGWPRGAYGPPDLQHLQGLRPTPLDAALQAEQVHRAYAALSRIRPADQRLLELFCLCHHSLAEIGLILDLPPAIVKKRLHRARARLRREFGALDPRSVRPH